MHFFLTAAYNVTLLAVHLPGVESGEADVLCRNSNLSFFEQNPVACKVPVTIPPGLPRGTGQVATGLYVTTLGEIASRLLAAKGLPDSTQQTDLSGQTNMPFCERSREFQTQLHRKL